MDSFKLKNIIKRTLIVLLVTLVVIQFIRPDKNVSTGVTDNDIAKMYTIPANVQVIMQKACNDCHSNNTTYPWYSNLQPVAWWLDDHIREGKSELNFSEFGTYKLLRQSRKLKKAAGEIEEGEMPLSSFTLIHRDAVLTAEEKAAITTWAKTLSQEILAKVPPEEIEADKKRRAERERQGK